MNKRFLIILTLMYWIFGCSVLNTYPGTTLAERLTPNVELDPVKYTALKTHLFHYRKKYRNIEGIGVATYDDSYIVSISTTDSYILSTDTEVNRTKIHNLESNSCYSYISLKRSMKYIACPIDSKNPDLYPFKLTTKDKLYLWVTFDNQTSKDEVERVTKIILEDTQAFFRG